jgi:hypothetical protein
VVLRGLLAAGFSVVALGGAAGAADPVVGLWTYQGGIVTVTPGATGFVATVVKPITFSSCKHPAGEAMWTLATASGAYAGTHQFLQARSSCAAGGTGSATWTIDGQDPNVLHFCAADPGTGTPGSSNGSSHCADLARAVYAPLAGDWSYSGGVVRVVGNLPRLLGTVVQRTRFSVCPHPKGEVVWEVTGGGSGLYTGTNFGFAGRSCLRREQHRAAFVPVADALYVRIARRPGVDPGVCGPATDCIALRRAGP